MTTASYICTYRCLLAFTTDVRLHRIFIRCIRTSVFKMQTPDMLKILEVVFIHALRYWLCEDLGCKCAVLFAQYVNNIQ